MFLPAILRIIIIGCLLLAISALSQAYKLPDTGQHTCYDADGNVIDCPDPGELFYGQDAQYQGPEPAYQDNDDGTVTDLNTELMWMQATADTDNDGHIDSSDELEWQPACDYCDALVYAGYTDWRLPDRRELISLLDCGEADPAINSVFDCRSDVYWSSSTLAIDPDYAWNVYFFYGRVSKLKKVKNHYVRCVRDGP